MQHRDDKFYVYDEEFGHIPLPCIPPPNRLAETPTPPAALQGIQNTDGSRDCRQCGAHIPWNWLHQCHPAQDTVTTPVFMSTDSAVRKLMPVASGCLKYFPDALLLVSWVSRAGNDKHNPGQPLHWAKEKSQDEPDCEVRHMLDFLRGEPADPGLEPLGELGHLASKAWRALAHLQRECDRVRREHEIR